MDQGPKTAAKVKPGGSPSRKGRDPQVAQHESDGGRGWAQPFAVFEAEEGCGRCVPARDGWHIQRPTRADPRSASSVLCPTKVICFNHPFDRALASASRHEYNGRTTRQSRGRQGLRLRTVASSRDMDPHRLGLVRPCLVEER
jgi:hypothetical protein